MNISNRNCLQNKILKIHDCEFWHLEIAVNTITVIISNDNIFVDPHSDVKLETSDKEFQSGSKKLYNASLALLV